MCAELPAPRAGLDPEWIDLHDLRNMRLVAECVTRAALARDGEPRRAPARGFPATSARGSGTRRSALQGSGCRSAKLKIRRGATGEPGRLRLTRCRSSRDRRCSTACAGSASHRDPSLAIRFSCINANACKECMIQVDGKTVYACTTRLRRGEMTLEPLPKKKLIKDLVTEIAPPDERLK